MRNAHEVYGWKLTPAICRSAYDTGTEVCTVKKVDHGKGADGYHVESPKGATWYVSYWETGHVWHSQKLVEETPSMCLRNGSRSLRALLETLRSTERMVELQRLLQTSLA